ncbi:ferredoxin--NADP reductase [Craterilacuibacter sp.]|uniref:ferredoxin--NADP reductase n=1 Tax=Craterilacuibacter sp. TaxID=2870909 RepID=UPI003F2C6E71
MQAPTAENFSAETILWTRRWSEKLISFRISRPADFRFTPGQFARLGLAQDSGKIWRAYSMVSAPWDEYLEFFSILVPDGQFTSRLKQLQVGDTLLLDQKPNGFFTADRLPDGCELWLLATGTGLAPYLSILQQPELWARFEHIVLVHAVREAGDLAYTDEIAALRQHPLWAAYGHKLRYVPVVTRDAPHGMLNARIPALIEDGRLEAAAGLTLTPEHSRFMICGNPKMVADTFRTLLQRGYSLSRLKTPGQIVLENGW